MLEFTNIHLHIDLTIFDLELIFQNTDTKFSILGNTSFKLWITFTLLKSHILIKYYD